MILYRFRPFNQHTITELLTEKLHFSHPSTWNDPFEWSLLTPIYKGQDTGHRYACFAENLTKIEVDIFQNILMWSHYADSHKGICIEYEHILAGFGKGISYDGLSYQYWSKHLCWSYENEFRIVGGTEISDFEGVNITYKETNIKIKAIYCGVKFEESQLETLKLIKGKRDFAIFTGTVENYNSIKFTNTGAVERT